MLAEWQPADIVALALRSSSPLTASPYLSAYQYFSRSRADPESAGSVIALATGEQQNRERLRKEERCGKGETMDVETSWGELVTALVVIVIIMFLFLTY
jgi:hypothetical protein